MAVEYLPVAKYWDGGNSSPAGWYGHPTVVGLPRPNARSPSASSWLRIRPAIMIVPTFDDSRRMSAVVQCSMPSGVPKCGSASVYGATCGSTRYEYGTANSVSGATCPCSSAHERVMSLFVEPGSNRSVSGAFLSPEAATCAGVVAVAPSTVAIATTSPSVTSTTTAM